MFAFDIPAKLAVAVAWRHSGASALCSDDRYHRLAGMAEQTPLVLTHVDPACEVET
jgi:hypothetical protein